MKPEKLGPNCHLKANISPSAVNSYGGGIGLTNMYATVKRKPNFSRSGLCQLEFAFRRFSYRFDFWVKRDLCGRSIFKEELDDAVMRFWKIYESYHTV